MSSSLTSTAPTAPATTACRRKGNEPALAGAPWACPVYVAGMGYPPARATRDADCRRHPDHHRPLPPLSEVRGLFQFTGGRCRAAAAAHLHPAAPRTLDE